MGCDIHSVAIDAFGVRIETGEWEGGCPFGWRSYAVFGFLAGVRNYSGVPPLSEPRGLPADLIGGGVDYWLGDHSFSWLSVSELESFDYDAEIEDRRVSGEVEPGLFSGACTAEPGWGKRMTWRQFLGNDFFRDVAELRRIGADRVAFGFDS